MPSSIPSPPKQGAGFWVRAGARLLDVVYVSFLGLFVGVFSAVLLGLLQAAGFLAPGWAQRLHGFHFSSFFFGLPASLAYHTVVEALCGATVGKALLGLRVLQEDGGPLGWDGAFRRNLAYFWDGLFFGAVGWESMKKNALRQRFGDHWARTLVVRKAGMPAGSERPWTSFFLAFLLGSAVNICLAVSGLMILAF